MIAQENNETAYRILDSHDLISNPKLDAFLHMVSQRPLWERLKLLNSKSPNKAYPRFLYKYRPLSLERVDQANRLREYLVESKLWLSSPASFNDPFDMRGRHTFDGTPRAKRKLIISKLQKYRPELTNKQREVEASNLLVNGTLINNPGQHP